MPHAYAHALRKAIADGLDPDVAVTRLVELLKREGKTKILPAIAREIESLSVRAETQTPTLTLAHQEEKTRAQEGLRTQFPNASENMTVTTDENLIGGWRYRDANTLVDASYKTALTKLYHHIIAT